MRSRVMVFPMRPRKRERGFALLVVFLFAAVVAFSLYRQLPRAAFESTRDKEQLLIDRGNEFKRAIQVFYATNRRYPANMDELEKAADKRYLRRRYLDPMTGKDEWRIIHTNGSFLTDSLVQKPPAQVANGTPGVQGTAAAPLGANNMNTPPVNLGSNLPVNTSGPGNDPSGFAAQAQAVNPAVLRRPSDRIANLDLSNNPFNPANDDGADDRPPFNDPNTFPPITLLPQNEQQPGVQQAGSQQPGFPQPGFPQQGLRQQGIQQPGLLPGPVNVPGLTGNPAGATNSQPDPFAPPAPAPFVGGQPPFGASPESPAQLAEQQARAQTALATAFGPQPDASPFPPPQPSGNSAGILPGFTPAPQGIPGQLPGQGGMNPQPVTVPGATTSNAAPNLVSIGPGGQVLPFGSQSQQGVISPNRTAGGVGLPQGGANAGATNPAIALVNQQIRTPTPQTAQSQNAIQPAANNLGSPGIAGVASTFDGPSIKSFLERTNYKEWEFVFQPQQGGAGQIPGGQPNPLQPGQQRAGQQNPGQQNFGLPGSQGFGQTSRPNTSQPNPSRQQQGPLFQGPGPSQGFQNLFGTGPGQPQRR
jgi:hypothetical protein